MRELIWALVAALVVYLLVIGWQMWRTRGDEDAAGRVHSGERNESDARPPREAEPRAVAEPGNDEDDEVFVFEPYLAKASASLPDDASGVPQRPPAGMTAGVTAEPLQSREQAQAALDFSAPPPAEGFQLELEVRQLRRDIVQLRNELAEQRREAQRQAEAMQTLKEHVDSTLASQGISPEYNEALVFARRGMDVGVIAERCGISVAEAELVHSLAQGREAKDDAS